MTIRLCPLYDSVKTRAMILLAYDCPNNHSLEKLRSTDDIWLVRNTVAIALCIARDEIAPRGSTRPYFNKGNFRQAASQIVREIRRRR